MTEKFLIDPTGSVDRRDLAWPAMQEADGATLVWRASEAMRTAAPRRGRARALAALARPKQWVKNALVIAAPGAAGALGQDDVPVRVITACAAFCLISAGIYALNDVRDRDEDRLHPRKRLRPVAAGELSPREATLFGVAALIIGLAVCAVITPLLAVVGLGYITLTVSYTYIWRHVPVLDLVALAGGFVLRAIAGGVAAPVGLSRWFVLVVTCAAIFVAAGKRLAELLRARASGRDVRRVLEHYSARGLQAVLAGSGAGALFAYCVWVFELPAVNGIPWRPLTVIPFAACLLRYGQLVRAGSGEAPEEVLMSDWAVAFGGLLWLVLFALSVNAAG
jgi:decaprenyl-phosphate phosphoribosyltransferase